ncbi:MAG TPA: S41 family peptidase [Candidatus Baltobacteraceae bacterium]|nr:S41 family peptidase [Candidatus Baltobacteraceae bacterium]
MNLTSRVRAAFCASVLLLAGTLPVFASEALPSATAQDVNESYHLLATSYYRPIDPQTLLDKARAALIDVAHKHGSKIAVVPLRASDDPQANTQALDSAIADAAADAHGSTTEYAYAAIDAMARAVDDRYTEFMTPSEYKAFKDALDPEKISGIGVLIQPDATSGLIDVSYVVPGTPADRAGLQPGDEIATIDGASTKGITTDNASKLLRGKAGTTVNLGIVRGNAAPFATAITRSELEPPTVVSKMLPGSIGYVYVLAFGQSTPDEFDTAISRLKNAGARALVLDLRNDGGGYVESALQISERFIADKPLLTVEERGSPDTTVTADSDGVAIDVPVTVLVNEYTASASEITAGALQDDGIASLIGTRTFGKGVMQTLTPLADGAAIKITTAHYLTPNHQDINLKGIQPDLTVAEPRDARFGDPVKDPQLRAALDFLQKKIAQVKTTGH